MDLPEELKTLDDYTKACENFVVPFLFQQSKRIADVLEALHTDIRNKNLDRERINDYLNQINEIASFIQPKNPMYPYFERLVELENELRAAGAFTEEIT